MINASKFDSKSKLTIFAVDKIDFKRFTKDLLFFADITLMLQIDCSRFKVKNLSSTFNFE